MSITIWLERVAAIGIYFHGATIFQHNDAPVYYLNYAQKSAAKKRGLRRHDNERAV